MKSIWEKARNKPMSTPEADAQLAEIRARAKQRWIAEKKQRKPDSKKKKKKQHHQRPTTAPIPVAAEATTEQQQQQQPIAIVNAEEEPSFALQVVSDLHIESDLHGGLRGLSGLLRRKAPFLALCGDVGVLSQGTGTAQYAELLRYCAAHWKHVFIVAGNHEAYGSSVSEAHGRLRAMSAALGNVSFLERDFADIAGCNLRVLGCTLWSFVPPEHEAEVSHRVNDYALIRVSSEDAGSRRLSIADTNAWHEEAVHWLAVELDRARQEGKRCIVLTHHGPTAGSNAQYRNSTINCAFETDLTWLVHAPPLLAWFFGHTHVSSERTMDGVLVKSNQLGYGMGKGQANFDPTFVFRVASKESNSRKKRKRDSSIL